MLNTVENTGELRDLLKDNGQDHLLKHDQFMIDDGEYDSVCKDVASQCPGASTEHVYARTIYRIVTLPRAKSAVSNPAGPKTVITDHNVDGVPPMAEVSISLLREYTDQVIAECPWMTVEATNVEARRRTVEHERDFYSKIPVIPAPPTIEEREREASHAAWLLSQHQAWVKSERDQRTTNIEEALGRLQLSVDELTPAAKFQSVADKLQSTALSLSTTTGEVILSLTGIRLQAVELRATNEQAKADRAQYAAEIKSGLLEFNRNRDLYIKLVIGGFSLLAFLEVLIAALRH